MDLCFLPTTISFTHSQVAVSVEWWSGTALVVGDITGARPAVKVQCRRDILWVLWRLWNRTKPEIGRCCDIPSPKPIY